MKNFKSIRRAIRRGHVGFIARPIEGEPNLHQVEFRRLHRRSRARARRIDPIKWNYRMSDLMFRSVMYDND